MEYFLLTSRKVGVRSKPPRKRRIGMVSPVVDISGIDFNSCVSGVSVLTWLLFVAKYAVIHGACHIPLDGEPSIIYGDNC